MGKVTYKMGQALVFIVLLDHSCIQHISIQKESPGLVQSPRGPYQEGLVFYQCCSQSRPKSEND